VWLGNAEADPEVLVEGEEWGPPELESMEEARPSPEKMKFSLEMACFGEI